MRPPVGTARGAGQGLVSGEFREVGSLTIFKTYTLWNAATRHFRSCFLSRLQRLQHSRSGTSGWSGWAAECSFRKMRTAFPDLKVAPEALISDDESIALAYMLTGIRHKSLGARTTWKKSENKGPAIPQIQRWQNGPVLGPCLLGHWPYGVGRLSEHFGLLLIFEIGYQQTLADLN